MGSLPVSVIMPTYNRGEMIAQSIESVLGQNAPAREVIVVDDGSDDATPAALARYADRITILSKVNGGKSSALNLGLGKATQPYIWIFDDDDIACPSALERLYCALSERPEIGFAYGLIDKFYGEWPSPTTEPCISFVSDSSDNLYLKLLQDFFIWQGAMLVRAECYRTIGEFDTRFARSQDYEMALRLMRRYRGVPVPHVIFHQRHHEGERGPRNARFRAGRAEDVWTKYNRLMFREVYESHRLEDFCRPQGERLSERERITALLQRGAIMARKGVWKNAIADMVQAADALEDPSDFRLNPQEMCALRAVFEHGARSSFASLGEAIAFRRAIDRFDERTRAAVVGNLLLPVSHRLRTMPSRHRRLLEARQTFYILAAFLGTGAIGEYLAARKIEHRHFGIRPLVGRS